MRIGVDIRCLMDGKRTGVEEYTLGVLEAMLRQSPNDTFVLFANSRKPMRLPAFHAPNVELRTFRYPNTLFNLSLKVAGRPALDRLLGGLDVLFVPSMRLAPLSARCPLVVTMHDLSFVRHPEYFSRHRRLWHSFMAPGELVRHAARVIAVSNATSEDVQRLYGLPDERIAVIHSGIRPHMRPVDRESANADRVRRRYALPQSFVLFLGTLEPRKNLHGLLDAYTAVRARGAKQHLVLAGERGWIDETFFTLLKKNPFAPDIHCTGVIDDADKPALYSLADLFVYPSLYEGFGFPPLEALACGTPVVTSSNAAIPEVVGEWAMLVNPADTPELAAVMGELLTRPLTLPVELPDLIHTRFSWDDAGRRTLDVLRQATRVSVAVPATSASLLQRS